MNSGEILSQGSDFGGVERCSLICREEGDR